jgi:hypothetical protein
MSYTNTELRSMLEDVVSELHLSGKMQEKHGPLGTAPSELVRLVLEEKDRQIFMLKRGFNQIELKSEKEQLPIHSVVESLPCKPKMDYVEWLKFNRITENGWGAFTDNAGDLMTAHQALKKHKEYLTE